MHDIDIWPGFFYKIERMGCTDVPMLNLDACFLAVKLESALEIIQDIRL